MSAFGVFFSSVLLGAAGALAASRFAGKTGFLDFPNERSSHRTPTPRGGGIGMFAAFVLSAVASGAPAAFLFPIGTVSAMALCGDRFPLSPALRLYGQLFLSLSLVMGMGIRAADSPYCLALILFWTVFIAGTANLSNFMDGIDGNAAIAGIVGFGLLALHFLASGLESFLFMTAVCVALGCLGFLPFNILPGAKVFMGDVGSILIGFVFGSMVYIASRTFEEFICMVSFLFPCYAEGVTTMYIRLRDGENLTLSHRRHIHQILANEGGVPHWRISLAFGALQLVVGMAAIEIRPYGGLALVTFLGVSFAAYATGSMYFRARTEGKRERVDGRTGEEVRRAGPS